MQKMYKHRFTIFLISLCALLFGNLLFPESIYESIIAPIFMIISILSGILLVHKKKRGKWLFFGLLLIIIITYLIEALFGDPTHIVQYTRFTMLFLFFAMVTKEVISQVWRSKKVDETVILGLICGYICLGMLGFFMCMSIELLEPNSFSGITQLDEHPQMARQNLLYYSYITILTIGYGDIVPTSALAKNASLLIGLLGQFYMVIITAIVVGKFLYQRTPESNKDESS